MVYDPQPPTLPAPSPGWQLLLIPVGIGSLVALTLGVYAGLHDPQGVAVNLAGFSGPLPAKAWLATGAGLLALAQLTSSWLMYRRLRWDEPPGSLATVHRWSGRAAFLLAVPVAIHCLYAVGFQTGTPRALVHSLLGCLFFGAFVVKMLGLRRDGLPGWAIPAIGGVVFTALVGLWLTSSLWYFTTSGVRF